MYEGIHDNNKNKEQTSLCFSGNFSPRLLQLFTQHFKSEDTSGSEDIDGFQEDQDVPDNTSKFPMCKCVYKYIFSGRLCIAIILF